MKTTEEKRIVQAPYSGSSDLPGQVLSVELGEDEEVNWLWSHFPNGQSVVTGYEIIKKDGAKMRFNIESAITEWLRSEDKGAEEKSERSKK
jgi:hypothetical protein